MPTSAFPPGAAYSPIMEPPSRTPSVELDSLPSKAEVLALGKPRQKSNVDKIDTAAVMLSLTCLVISVCVVTPRLGLAWRLGFEGQIVVIGFLLGIMNLCLKRGTSLWFLIFEQRWGGSTLQNYDAILRNTTLLPRTTGLWRGTILALIILPLALSVAYKRFTGGESSTNIYSDYPGTYGIASAPLAANDVLNNSIYHMMTATAPYMIASASDLVSPTDFPIVYGYNALLLDHSSAAMLDMPMPDYVSSIQQNLTKDEFWTLSAPVNGILARYNSSAQTLKDDSAFWQTLFDIDDPAGLAAFELYESASYNMIGLRTGLSERSSGTYCLLGTFPTFSGNEPAGGVTWFYNVTDPESIAFRNAALIFNVQRVQCSGVWQVNRTGIQLVSGECTGELTDQSFLMGGHCNPFPLDALPVLHYNIESYVALRVNSTWKIPTYAMSVASMYWARLNFLAQSPLSWRYCTDSVNVSYIVDSETVTSTRTTLNARWLLDFVLALQPLLTCVTFLLVTLCYSSPIDKGFGMIAVLSGVNKDSLDLVRGAALSGELSKPVKLGIEVDGVDDTLMNRGDMALRGHGTTGRIAYTLGQRLRKTRPLERGKRYM